MNTLGIFHEEKQKTELKYFANRPTNYFKKQPMIGFRPGSRFGQNSLNQFFARHCPHPRRVINFKGQLHKPLNAVFDETYATAMKNRKVLPYQFPPDLFNQHRLFYKDLLTKNSIPSNAINTNSNIYPINTITGWPILNPYTLEREKSLPVNLDLTEDITIDKLTPEWRIELGKISDILGLEFDALHRGVSQMTISNEDLQKSQPRPLSVCSNVASVLSNRLTPKARFMRRLEKVTNEAHAETQTAITMSEWVENLLCQILQTDDKVEAKEWMNKATEREKLLVLNLIRTAIFDKYEQSLASRQHLNEDCQQRTSSVSSQLSLLPKRSASLSTDRLTANSRRSFADRVSTPSLLTPLTDSRASNSNGNSKEKPFNYKVTLKYHTNAQSPYQI